MSRAAFYCMSSDLYFLGAVGMINSLRLQGHGEPIYLLDLGLSDAQRELLTGETRIVTPPAGTPPWLAKTCAPLAHPAETMILIDADMIATRPLTDLLERAREGRVIAFENNMDRFVPEWGDALGLGALERRPYACSGLVLAGGEPGAEAIRLLDERQRRVEFERTYFAANEVDYVLLYLDQDVLNAILASRAVERDAVEVLPYRLAPFAPFEGIAEIDRDALHCEYPDGTRPYVLHHILEAKPWLRPMHNSLYSRLLKRLLVGPDLPIRVPENWLPLRMRSGSLAYLERKRVDASVRLRWHLGIFIHHLRTRLAAGSRNSNLEAP
jgi:hypothetical protein